MYQNHEKVSSKLKSIENHLENASKHMDKMLVTIDKLIAALEEKNRHISEMETNGEIDMFLNAIGHKK